MAEQYRKADGFNEEPVSLAKPLPVSLVQASLLATVSAAAASAAGTGYVPADTITLAGGDYSQAAVLTVTHTKVITAAVVAGGTGGTPGAVTITGTTGTGTKFQATGTITAGGILSGALTVTVAGDYTVNPTSIAAEPVTGGSLTGTTVILTMGVLTVSVTTAGVYREVPATATQGSTSGSGSAATFTLTTAAASGSAVTIGAGTALIGKVGIDQTTPGTTNGFNLLQSYRTSYQAVIAGYAAYATPTDIFCISGSASKTVLVTGLYITVQSTTATLATYTLLRRSTLNTGGTPTTYTPAMMDTTDPAATAVVTTYASAPTTGTLAGTLEIVGTATAVLTAAPAISNFFTQISSANTFTLYKPVMLRGVNEALCINFAGVALPLNFVATFHIVWEEV